MWKVISPSICRSSAETLESFLNVNHPIERNVKINWGNSQLSLHDSRDVFGNKLEAVGRSADKQRFFDLCEDLGTVPVVKEYNGPCFQHLDRFSQNGRGVVYVDNPADFSRNVLTTKAIKGIELRSYFCYNSKPVIFTKAKLPDGADTAVQNSTNYGYKKELPKFTGIRSVIEELTKQVANRLELSYGAIDFIVDKDGLVWILESNSAPTLITEEVCDVFAKAIAQNWR